MGDLLKKKNMKDLINLVVLIVLVFLFYKWVSLIFRSFFRKEIILEDHRGLLYKNGKYEKTLEPGAYWINPNRHTLTRVDIRPRAVQIPGQEILCADNVGIKISITGRIKIIDPYQAFHADTDWFWTSYTRIQVAAREVAGTLTLEQLLTDRDKMSPLILEKSVPLCKELGAELLELNIRDIMLPNELKLAYTQVLKARKEGEAALEKARGESAALRNLANAAKVMENNPTLLQLRALHAMAETKGGTIVLGLPEVTKTS